MSWYSSFLKTIDSTLFQSVGLLGQLYYYENQQHSFGEASHYWFCQIELPDGTEEVLLLTTHELITFLQDAEKQREDVDTYIAENAADDTMRRLLGKLHLTKNINKQPRELEEHYLLQVEMTADQAHVPAIWPEGRVVLRLAELALSSVRKRAENNQEDVKAFLDKHFLKDLMD